MSLFATTSCGCSSSCSGGTRNRPSSSSSSRRCSSSCSARYTTSRSTASPPSTASSSGSWATAARTRRFAGLAITLVVRREGGILKRLRATPLPPATYLTAVLVSTLVVFLPPDGSSPCCSACCSTTQGGLRAGSLSGPCSCSARAAFAALGIGLAALIRSAEGASAVVNLDRPADGVPLGLVRLDDGLSRRAPGRRGRACRSRT